MSDMQQAHNDVKELVNAWSEVFLGTLKAAAQQTRDGTALAREELQKQAGLEMEKIRLNAQLEEFKLRLAIRGEALLALAAQEQAMRQMLETLPAPARVLYERGLEDLRVRQVALLQQAGLQPEAARQALTQQALPAAVPEKVYRRKGRAFKRVPATNGTAHGQANGTANDHGTPAN